MLTEAKQEKQSKFSLKLKQQVFLIIKLFLNKT